MKFGILRDDVEDNWDEEGYPLYEEFVYADSLDLNRYYDCGTICCSQWSPIIPLLICVVYLYLPWIIYL